MADLKLPPLPEIGEKYLLAPALLKVPHHNAEDSYEDDFATKCAWGAHGYDTGMEPFYSAEQLKAALKEAWKASREQALREAAKLCEAERDRTLSAQTTSGDTTTDLMLRQVAFLGFDASAAAIRGLDGQEQETGVPQ